MEYIHVTGYPRSGNTWSGKLLSDVVGGTWLPAREASAMRLFVPNKIDVEREIVVTKNHSFRDEIKDSGKTVLIYRDPRDMAVSMWHYQGKKISLLRVIETIIEVRDPQNDYWGPYKRFIKEWWDSADSRIAYEELHISPKESIERVLKEIGYGHLLEEPNWNDHILRSIERQKFGKVKASAPQQFSHSMRKGIIGDWRNNFTQLELDYINQELGDLLEMMGYEKVIMM